MNWFGGNALRIQRIYCKNCKRTTNVLPCFALAFKPFFTFALEQLVNTIIENHKDWRKWLDSSIELSTAYKWLKQLKPQIQTTLPTIREKILTLKPNTVVISESTVLPMTEISELESFVRYAQQLQQLAISLSENDLPSATNLFCFLNVFVYQQTGKPLLRP